MGGVGWDNYDEETKTYTATGWGYANLDYFDGRQCGTYLVVVREGSTKAAEYEEFLKPFVVVDPAPFDDISGAQPTDLLDAAISALIYESDKMNTYEVFEGEVTGLLVPQTDVEAYFKRLFGTEVPMQYQNVSDSFYNVLYNSERQSYIIPITSVDPLYTPKVFNTKKTGSSITLTVGYIIGSEWAQIKRGSYTAPEPAKYMKITLREDADGYHIGSLQSSEAVDVAGGVRATVPAQTTAPQTTFSASVETTETASETSAESTTGETTDEAAQTTAA